MWVGSEDWPSVHVVNPDDLFAQEGLLEPSFYISRREALEKFPMLKKKGGIVW